MNPLFCRIVVENNGMETLQSSGPRGCQALSGYDVAAVSPFPVDDAQRLVETIG